MGKMANRLRGPSRADLPLKNYTRPLYENERNFLLTNGWVPSGSKWIDPLIFEEDGYFAFGEYDGDALHIQRERIEEAQKATLEYQRAQFLGLLSERKRGPIPLEQQRAGLLFILERRAIRLIEDG